MKRFAIICLVLVTTFLGSARNLYNQTNLINILKVCLLESAAPPKRRNWPEGDAAETRPFEDGRPRCQVTGLGSAGAVRGRRSTLAAGREHAFQSTPLTCRRNEHQNWAFTNW